MVGNRFVSLPAVTALNHVIGGRYDGSVQIGIRIDTHAFLHDFFGEIGIEVGDEPSISKKVRATIERLNTNPAEHAAFRTLLEQLADPRYYSWGDYDATMEYLESKLKLDGYSFDRSGAKPRLVAIAVNSAAALALSVTARALNLESVQSDLDRAISDADRDPAGALTSACSTVESVCKCILDDLNATYPNSKDIKGLATEVAKHLNLSPGREDLPSDFAQDIRQILSGLLTTAAGIGALRTHAGDAHGRGRKLLPVDSRIARLAIHAASTISLFYVETWERLKSLRVTPKK